MGIHAADEAASGVQKASPKDREAHTQSPLSAVVCPLTPRELPAALRNIALWGEKILPLRAQSQLKTAARPRFVFSFNCAENGELTASLHEAFDRQPALKDAFARMDVSFCNLPPEKDIYLRQMPDPPPEFGTKAGPNWLWYETLKALRAEPGFIFLMETDCVPLAPNWLKKLDAVCRQNPDAWVVGSHYCGASPLHWSIARHINGNALYHLGDPAFWKFLEEFFWPWLNKRIREREPQLAYDCAWEVFLNRQEMERAGNIDWLTARLSMQRFRLSNFIVNVAGHAEQNGYYYWTRANILDRYPNAAFVHGPLVKPDSFVRNGIALGKPALDKALKLEDRTLTYEGPADKEKLRFRRSFWLPDRFLGEDCTIRLRFALKCSLKSGVNLEINDSNGIPLAAQRFEVYKFGNARRCKLECKLVNSHVFLTLEMRFDCRDNNAVDQTIEMSETFLELAEHEKLPLRVKRIWD